MQNTLPLQCEWIIYYHGGTQTNMSYETNMKQIGSFSSVQVCRFRILLMTHKSMKE